MKRYSVLNRKTITNLADGIEQVRSGGRIVVVRPADSKFTFQQFYNSLVRDFKPKQPNVFVRIVNEASLPKLKR